MNDLISVIMPVYQVEAYLQESIESVLNQDHRELELILIDDGSPDNCGAICDDYAEKDSRVRVIHQENGGAAAAKNAGLRIAKGAWLSFVDSDDYLEPGAYSHMLKLLKAHRADAVQCSFRDVYRNRTESHIQQPCVLNEHQYLVRFPKDWTCPLLWNKLYRRSLFAGIFFEEGHKIDDEYFTYQGFLNPCKVVLDDRIVYNYRRRASGVMCSPQAAEQRIRDGIDCVVKRRRKVTERWPELRRQFDESYMDAVWYLSLRPGNTEDTIAMLKDHLKRYFRTWGNTIPPRYLWPYLWGLYRTDTKTLVENSRIKQAEQSTEDYFA